VSDPIVTQARELLAEGRDDEAFDVLTNREAVTHKEGMGAKLTKWLKAPTYDWAPPEVDKEFEDNLVADVWDVMIESTLPALRQGNRQMLDGVVNNIKSYEPWQINALFYAVLDGFPEGVARGFCAETLLEVYLDFRKVPKVVKEHLAAAYGTGDRKKIDRIAAVLNDAGAYWGTTGWIIPEDANFTKLAITQPPQIEQAEGKLDFTRCQLSTLEGLPYELNGSLVVTDNKLTSLKDCPQRIHGSIAFDQNKITSLREGPRWIGEDYACGHNPLTSLDGCPAHIPGYFYCPGTKITSLRGGPRTIGGYMSIEDNPKLSSLEGAPTEIGAHVYVGDLPKLESLEGLLNTKINGPIYGWGSRSDPAAFGGYASFATWPPSPGTPLTKTAAPTFHVEDDGYGEPDAVVWPDSRWFARTLKKAGRDAARYLSRELKTTRILSAFSLIEPGGRHANDYPTAHLSFVRPEYDDPDGQPYLSVTVFSGGETYDPEYTVSTGVYDDLGASREKFSTTVEGDAAFAALLKNHRKLWRWAKAWYLSKEL
jgi:hypothetical protein